jgi:hypothetical protein
MSQITCVLLFIRSKFSKTLKTILFFILVFLLSSFEPIKPKPAFISIAFFKSTSPDFIQHEKSFWVPIQKELIKAGRKDAWYMYKVLSAEGKELPYDYIRFNVFHDKAQTLNPYADIQQFINRAYPGQDMNDVLKKTNTTRTMVWEQLYEINGKSVSWLLDPSDLLFMNLNTTHQTKNKKMVLIAIEPLKKENLYEHLELSKYKKRLMRDGLTCELVVSAIGNR